MSAEPPAPLRRLPRPPNWRPPLQLPPQRPPNQGNPKPKAVGKGDLVCSIQQGKEGRGELLSAQFGQRPGHLLLIDRVGVKVQVGVVNFVVIEFLKFWNNIDTTIIFELAILYRENKY